MSKPGAKQGDRIVATDTHIVLMPSPGGPVPTPTPMPFDGPLVSALSQSTFIDDKPAAVVGSKAKNTPPHVPTGGPFQTPPSNEGEVKKGSDTVFIDDKGAARSGDLAITCNDPTDLPVGVVVASGTVIVG
jgi:uncharacterized Zn-binding protein involved in type VI secretion